ncbi:hypothetical protein R1flu_014725 [Riccia fluitans]|uniref:Serpin domain-containing protein n=1 Tax=Riccia fluitans TaxID=41844 RepID=A0ABD1YK97_9MARC
MDESGTIEQQTGFALDFYKVVAGKNENAIDAGNSLLSPISITTAVAMAGAGAKGKTLEEIRAVLKLPEGEAMHQFTSQLKSAILKDGADVGGPSLHFANGLWVEKTLTLKPSFQELVKGKYGAEASLANFGNKAEEERTNINKWVSDATKGKIENLLPPSSLNDKTAMVLANALYFKGTWKKPFKPEETKDHDFHLLDGKTVSVPYMTSKNKQVVRNFNTHKVLKLPYVQSSQGAGADNRSFSMFFILPNEKDGIAQLEKDLDTEMLTKHLNWTSREVKVGEFRLPKFKFSAGFKASEALQALGLKAPFSQGADFSNMVEGPNAELLYLSEVFHKCFIEVNEEGTEAAAATGAVMMLRSLPMPETPIDFVADHPFLFVLREDKTGLILFFGRITNPSLSQ